MRAFVILAYSGDSTYKWNIILNCYNSLRKFEPTALIIIVNNFSDSLHPSLSNDKNLRYNVNIENTWELGAIQTGFYQNQDVDQFFIVQDGITFVNNPPVFENDTMFWENEFRNIAPDLDTIRSWCENYFPQFTSQYALKTNRVCHGLMACLSKEILTAIMDIGLKNIRVTNKSEAVASEGVFGFLLRIVKPDIPFYNNAGDDPNAGYKNDPSKYEFMTKKAYGRISGIGNSRHPENPVFYSALGSLTHPLTPHSFHTEGVIYSSLGDALSRNPSNKYHSIFMNYYISNREALLELTNKRFHSFSVEANPFDINSLLRTHNHDMYILKHWGYFFYPENKDVKNDMSFLCNWVYHYTDNIHVPYNSNNYVFLKTDIYMEEIQIRSCINEIIVRNDYRLELFTGMQNKVIFDIGANHGVATIILAKQNPDSIIYSFEPDPKCFEYLKENIRLNNLTNVIPHHAAVTKEGINSIELMLNPNHSGANTVCSDVSLCKKYWNKSVEHVTVNAVSFDNIIQKYNIKSVDLLKIDCEGAEYEILYESTSLKEHIIKNIVGEFHGLEYTTVSKDPKNTKDNLTRYIRNYISGIINIT